VGLREYEVLLILPAEADEKLVGTAVDRIAKAVEPSGGAVGTIDRWGRRRFAFELAHQTEGYYVLVEFTAEPPDVASLERALTLADEVVRAKVTMRTPKRTERPERSQQAAARPQAAAPATPAADEPESAPGPQPETVPEPQAAAEPETAEESSPAPA
jgi:small subunit ribosomal protein S6